VAPVAPVAPVGPATTSVPVTPVDPVGPLTPVPPVEPVEPVELVTVTSWETLDEFLLGAPSFTVNVTVYVPADAKECAVVADSVVTGDVPSLKFHS
jgi:hypothetical protein